MRARPLLFALFLVVGCAEQAEPPTEQEKAQEINAVFESREQYTVRTMDSTDILAYLASHPETRMDSAGIRDFYASAEIPVRVVRER
jgi:hypothetical protein